MISSLRRDAASVRRPADAFAWLRARPWTYACVVLALWSVVPGLRRLVDWKSSFSSISLVSIVPLFALVPAAAALLFTTRASRLGRVPLVAAWLWTGAFGYAYAIGIASGNVAASTYAALGFLLPMAFGLAVSTLDVAPVVLYERIAAFALVLAVPIALYAFYQYVLPPPWDLLWIQQTGFVNVGTAAAFAFRPFGTLNGPGPFADFLTGVLVLNLPRLRGATPPRIAAMALLVCALALTLVRADWIACIAGVLVFVALSPRKAQNLSVIVGFALVLSLVAANAGALFGNAPAGIALQGRFESLLSLSTDSSYRDRQKLFGDALTSAVREPTGQGLGVVGTAAKLGASESTVDFDNGYIARLTEMGYFGTAAYLGTILFTLGATIARHRSLARERDSDRAAIAAAAIAMQVALILLDVSGDHHEQFPGIFFWLSVALVFAAGAKRVTR